MAEFTKEAMKNQKLDGDEVISVKWSETDRFELSFQDHQEIVDNVREQAMRERRRPDEEGEKLTEELEPKEDDKFYQGTLSKDPSKVLMNAEFSLYEQKLRQAEKDKERLKNALKRVKKPEKSRQRAANGRSVYELQRVPSEIG